MGDGDPLAIFKESAKNRAPETPSPYPELAFVDASEGLPTSGTWIGYPLLADFNADGRADLVASNREEDGYNAWISTATEGWVRRIEGLPRDMAYGPACAGDANEDRIPDLVLSAHTDAGACTSTTVS